MHTEGLNLFASRFWLGSFIWPALRPEDGGITVPQNVCKPLPECRASLSGSSLSSCLNKICVCHKHHWCIRNPVKLTIKSLRLSVCTYESTRQPAKRFS
jgi:hypothetical protein